MLRSVTSTVSSRAGISNHPLTARAANSTLKNHFCLILTPTVDSDWVKVGQLIED